MPAPLPSLAELERLLASTQNRARRQLLAAFIRIRRQLPLSELERAIVSRNLEEAFRLIGLEPALNALAQVQVLTEEVRQAGWYEGLRGLPRAVLARPLLELSLGAEAQANPFSVQAIQQQNLRRITAIADETRGAIREILVSGIQAGVHPREVSLKVRRVIGLTRKQAVSVGKFRAQLEAQDRDPAQVTRMVDRYTRRQLALRAENIALTETFTALQEGKRAQWDRLQREGVIQGQDWEQEWVTANDERVCPICAPLDGQRAALGESFGLIRQPPAHPRCRCIVRLTLAGFRKGEPTNVFRRRGLAA